MTANQLRIGNLHEYLCGGEWQICITDIDDLKWLDKNPNDQNYRAVEISADLLVKLGFKDVVDTLFGKEYRNGEFALRRGDVGRWYLTRCNSFIVALDFIHQLQNTIFCLTGEELVYFN